MTTEAEKKTEDWMTTKWRPLMAVTYMATIWFDFIVGPIIFNILQYWNPGQAITTWTPLTLQGGGLYHISMGAILGIAAWTRGKEKVAIIENEKSFNQGYEGTPVASPSSEPVWLGQPTPSTPAYQEEPIYQEQPAAEFEVPEVAETQELTEAPEAPEEPEAIVAPEPVEVDPNRPLRRKRS
jgi:hypothetical protein